MMIGEFEKSLRDRSSSPLAKKERRLVCCTGRKHDELRCLSPDKYREGMWVTDGAPKSPLHHVHVEERHKKVSPPANHCDGGPESPQPSAAAKSISERLFSCKTTSSAAKSNTKLGAHVKSPTQKKAKVNSNLKKAIDNNTRQGKWVKEILKGELSDESTGSKRNAERSDSSDSSSNAKLHRPLLKQVSRDDYFTGRRAMERSDSSSSNCTSLSSLSEPRSPKSFFEFLDSAIDGNPAKPPRSPPHDKGSLTEIREPRSKSQPAKINRSRTPSPKTDEPRIMIRTRQLTVPKKQVRSRTPSPKRSEPMHDKPLVKSRSLEKRPSEGRNKREKTSTPRSLKKKADLKKSVSGDTRRRQPKSPSVKEDPRREAARKRSEKFGELIVTLDFGYFDDEDNDPRRRRLPHSYQIRPIERDYKDLDDMVEDGYLDENKSDSQSSQDSGWSEGERTWLVYRGGFAGAHLMKGGPKAPDGKANVRLDHSGDILQVDEEDVEKANSPGLDRCENLAQLRYLNESSVLHTLRQRYGSNLIHTCAGTHMLILNPMGPLSIYSDKVSQLFKGCKQEDMPPHIYAVAQTAYRSMLNTRTDQSILLLGRSGGGKTTNAKHALQYLLMAAGASSRVLTVEKLDAVYIVLEAFGNTKTVMNTNATRFTSLFSLDFDHAGQVANASVQVLMPERSRVARRSEGEPSYHVLYQMLAGLDDDMKKEMMLETCLQDHCLFMTPLQRPDDIQKSALSWVRILGAMERLGFSQSDMNSLFAVLAAIYHLGVAGAEKGPGGKSQFSKPGAAQKAAKLLGTSAEELGRAIFGGSSINSPRTSYRTLSANEKLAAEAPQEALDALEGIVIGLYAEVFNAVVALINRSISSSTSTLSSVLVVDSPGFQNPGSCGYSSGASFQDFCVNYCQERLQLLCHDITFTSQRDLYHQEGIQVELSEFEEWSSPAPLLAILEQSGSGTLTRSSQTDVRGSNKGADKKGILWLLDEEAICPGATDASFTDKIFQQFNDRESPRLISRGSDSHQFTIQHYQGTNPVTYNTKGWLKACRENPITRYAATVLQDSSRESISSLFVSCRGPVSHNIGGSVVGIEGTQSLRRASSIRRAFTTGTAGIKRKSLCLQTKFTVDGLIESLRRTRIHFVHCILPQHNAGLSDLKSSLGIPSKSKSPDELLLNVPLVRSQLRGAQILDAIRIQKQGFPEHMGVGEFRRRFLILAPADSPPHFSSVLDDRTAAKDLLAHLDLDKSAYKVGLSKVFFRSGVLWQLEEQRDEKISDKILRLQAYCRGYLGRKMYAKKRVEELAVRCIQRNVRRFMEVRSWPWWKLLTRLTPLLNVHRTEQELRATAEALEALRSKLEKVEKDKSELKVSNDRLEAKLSELTADLAEEHSTSTLATERLEAETGDRMRLEKDYKELHSQYKSLQQSSDRMETELLYSRAAALNGDVGSEEEDLDADAALYRSKYERVVRELTFLKQRLQQQHEEDLEQLLALKKQMEKKLADAYEEVEEQRSVVSQWKRKAQKLTQESNDTKLMLEEQSSRNCILEKRQRKFDTEIQIVQDELKSERLNREKTQREKDVVQQEAYSMEQQLHSMKLDLEMKEEKVTALTRELDDLTYGSHDAEEVNTLKRAKHELDSKLKDQEEELDELAGQVQMLEQARLRLEMQMETTRKEHRREVTQKDDEIDEVRCNAHKKVKALEAQLEAEHEERTALVREKHEMERRLIEATEHAHQAYQDETVPRLKRDLKRTKALLRDAHASLERAQNDTPSRGLIRQLRNQLEDAEFAKSAAVKGKQVAEAELADVMQLLEESQRARQDLDSQISTLQRERNDYSNHLEENEDELQEVLKKYKAAVSQLTADQITITEQANDIQLLEMEKNKLKETVAEVTTRLENLEGDSGTVSHHTHKRLEMKVRELESRLDLEQTSKQRLENQITRLKESIDKLASESDGLRLKEQEAIEASRKLSRQLREQRDESASLRLRDTEASLKKTESDQKIQTLQLDLQTARGDLKIALQRIQDLQAAMQGDDSDSSEQESDAESSSSDTSIESFLAVHTTSHVAGSTEHIDLNAGVKTGEKESYA